MFFKDIAEPEIIVMGSTRDLIKAMETTVRKRSRERHLAPSGKILRVTIKVDRVGAASRDIHSMTEQFEEDTTEALLTRPERDRGYARGLESIRQSMSSNSLGRVSSFSIVSGKHDILNTQPRPIADTTK